MFSFPRFLLSAKMVYTLAVSQTAPKYAQQTQRTEQKTQLHTETLCRYSKESNTGAKSESCQSSR